MTDSQTAKPAKAKKAPLTDRRVIADRQWIGQDGKELSVGDMTVVAVKYVWKATGEALEYRMGANQALDRAMWAFGAVTKLGNVVNTFVNRPDNKGQDVDPMPVLREWFEAASAGEWREPGEGPKGPKYDKDVLAGVIFDLLGPAAKGDVTLYRQRLDDDLSWYAKVRTQPQFMAEYAKRISERGEATISVADLA